MDPKTTENDAMKQLLQKTSELVLESKSNDGTENDEDINEKIFMLLMDISEPLTNLKTLLQKKVKINLDDYSFCLQDSQELESHENLADQCVEEKVVGQIDVQIKRQEKKINIVDVLKPIEIYEMPSGTPSTDVKIECKPNRINWMIDAHYKQEQERLNIPNDPSDWNKNHVKHWIQWAEKEFNLISLKLSDWNINGTQMLDMAKDEFEMRVPNDPEELFWTHFQLLRACKRVSVIDGGVENAKTMLNLSRKKRDQLYEHW